MSKRRKEFTFLVTVTAPAKVDTWLWPKNKRNVTATDVAREIRAMIVAQCMFSMDEGDVKLRRLRHVKAEGRDV